MAWTLNSIRIFVQESDAETSQIIPRLQPLSGGTILQVFGYDSRVQNLMAIVVGDTDRDALMNLPTTGSTYTLISPEGSMGTYLVRKASYKRVPNLCQTMRPDLAEDAPVYNFNLELYPSS